MVNKSKILSDLSKMAVDAMSTFAGLKKEVEIIANLKVNKIINKMNLVKRDEFEALKKLVQKIQIDKERVIKKPNLKVKKTKNVKKRSILRNKAKK